MTILYKYFPKHINFFESGMVRFTQRTALNDPFELLPACSVVKTVLHDSDSNIEIPHNIDIDYVESLEGLNSFGIFCLTEDKRNLLMWSHYASDHKGYVVGFDVSHPFFSTHGYFSTEENDSVHRVIYSDFRANQPKESKDWFIQKSNAWMYEKEHRVIRRLYEADCIKELTEEGSFERTREAISLRKQLSEPQFICLFEIPPEAVKSVVFGAKMDEEFKRSMQGLIHNYKDDGSGSFEFSFEEAYISPERFEIELA
jgi:hypothetical protein